MRGVLNVGQPVLLLKREVLAISLGVLIKRYPVHSARSEVLKKRRWVRAVDAAGSEKESPGSDNQESAPVQEARISENQETGSNNGG